MARHEAPGPQIQGEHSKLLGRTQLRFTDMTMRAGDDGEDIPCHRAVLARSSDVFDRMLSSQMKASAELLCAVAASS